MSRPQRADRVGSAEWPRHIRDHEDGLSFEGQIARCSRGHGVTRLAQPLFQQLADEVVGFDDEYVVLLMHCRPTTAGTQAHADRPALVP